MHDHRRTSVKANRDSTLSGSVVGDGQDRPFVLMEAGRYARDDWGQTDKEKRSASAVDTG